MAIPTWLWTETDGPDRDRSALAVTDGETDGACDIETDGETDLEAVSSDLELLASPVRLEILLTLADRDRPLRYGDLRDALSIDDNGRLNYHLRRLEGIVAGDDGDYALTGRGERLLERVSVAGPSDSSRTP